MRIEHTEHCPQCDHATVVLFPHPERDQISYTVDYRTVAEITCPNCKALYNVCLDIEVEYSTQLIREGGEQL